MRLDLSLSGINLRSCTSDEFFSHHNGLVENCRFHTKCLSMIIIQSQKVGKLLECMQIFCHCSRLFFSLKKGNNNSEKGNTNYTIITTVKFHVLRTFEFVSTISKGSYFVVYKYRLLWATKPQRGSLKLSIFLRWSQGNKECSRDQWGNSSTVT